MPPAIFRYTHHGVPTPHLDFDLSRIPHIDGHLFHYTSLQGLSGIIQSGEIWVSKIGFSNDYMETRYPAQLIQDCIVCCEGLKQDKIQRVANFFQKAISIFSEESCYSASFSKNGNLLSQWRGYTAGGGVALGIKIDRMNEIVKNSSFDLVATSYDLGDQVNLASGLIDVLFDDLDFDLIDEQSYLEKFVSESVIPTFRWLVPRIKHPGFSEEREIRLVHYEPEGNEIFVRSQGEKLVPYVKFAIPDGTIFSVIVGPNRHSQSVFDTVPHLFERSRYELEYLMDCQIPYDGI